MAYERWLATRCPKCGTRHDDWFDTDGRPLPEPIWEPAIDDCEGCRSARHAEKAIPEGETTKFVTMKPFGTVPVLDEEDDLS